MSETKNIIINTEIKPKYARACEICGRATESIDMHICSYCRYALALLIREWEVRDETDK